MLQSLVCHQRDVVVVVVVLRRQFARLQVAGCTVAGLQVADVATATLCMHEPSINECKMG